jgi:hypothetical protein
MADCYLPLLGLATLLGRAVPQAFRWAKTHPHRFLRGEFPQNFTSPPLRPVRKCYKDRKFPGVVYVVVLSLERRKIMYKPGQNL